jgi:hypothetical protein
MNSACDHHHHHHYIHQGLDPLIRSISELQLLSPTFFSVFQLFSFLVVCSDMISKGFSLVTFFASVKASSVCIHLSWQNSVYSAAFYVKFSANKRLLSDHFRGWEVFTSAFIHLWPWDEEVVFLRQILCSDSGIAADLVVWGCDAQSFGGYFPMVRRNIVFLSSGPSSQGFLC